MALANRRINVDITADPSDLEKKLNRASAAIKNFGRNARDSAPVEGVQRLGRLGNALDSVRLKARRAQAIGPLRFAGVGLGAGTALLAATTAAAKLSDMIAVTGNEAFTTEGKIRNMVSAFSRLDVIGGMQALHAAPKTLQEAGISASFAEQHYAAFTEVAKGLDNTVNTNTQSYKNFNDAVDEAGTGNANLARQALAAADALRLQNANVVALDMSLRKYNATASGVVVPFMGHPEEGIGSPGFNAGLDRDMLRGLRGNRQRPPRLPDIAGTRNQAAEIVAQARGDLPGVLRLQKQDAERMHKALDANRGNRKQHSAAVLATAAADAAVISTQKQMDAEALAAAEAAKAAKEKARAAAEAAARKAEAAREAYQRAMEQAQEEHVRYLKKLQDNAESLRDAAVRILTRRTEKRDIAREITEKQEQLALAIRVGSSHAIRDAKDELAKARTDRLAFMLEGAKIKPTRVTTPGRAPGYAFAGTTIHIGNLTLSGVQNPKDLLKALQRVPTSTGRRGRHGGTVHGI